MKEASVNDLSDSLHHSENERLRLVRENTQLREHIRWAFIRMGENGNHPPELLPKYVKTLDSKMEEMREVLECLANMKLRETLAGGVVQRIDRLVLRIPLSSVIESRKAEATK